MSTASADLRAAATHIETAGWVQGVGVAPPRYAGEPFEERATCADSALSATSYLANGARDALISRVGWIIRWNDKPGQTAENVIRTMRELADELDAWDES